MASSDGWIALALACSAIFASCGCSASGARWTDAASDPPGRPVASGTLPAAASTREAPRARWELAPQLSTFRRATPRGRSQHFTGELVGEVLANAVAAAYPALGSARKLEPGAVLVEAHRAEGSEDIIAYLAMVKRPPGFDPPGGDWEYLVVDRDGGIERRGPLPPCARCHAEAPFDHLFGVAGAGAGGR